MDRSYRIEIMFEQLISEHGVILERLETQGTLPLKVDEVIKRLDRVEQGLSIGNMVIRDHSGDIAELKLRSHSH